MRYLSCDIEGREYGVPLNQVREVIAFPEISPLPNMPVDYLGIINLRDMIIPILDLRVKFGAEQTLTHETAVVICSLEKGNVGLVVDCIHGVCAPSAQEVMSLEKIENGNLMANAGASIVAKEGKLVLIIDVLRTISASGIDLSGIQKSLTQLKPVA